MVADPVTQMGHAPALTPRPPRVEEAGRRSGATKPLEGGEQPAGPQHEAKPAASSFAPRGNAGQGGAEPVQTGRRPRTAPGSLERVPTNPPAYGAWNGRKVAMGTGESLLGPEGCGVLGKRCLT